MSILFQSQRENAKQMEKVTYHPGSCTIFYFFYFYFLKRLFCVTVELPWRENAGAISYREAAQSTYLTFNVL